MHVREFLAVSSFQFTVGLKMNAVGHAGRVHVGRLLSRIHDKRSNVTQEPARRAGSYNARYILCRRVDASTESESGGSGGRQPPRKKNFFEKFFRIMTGQFL